MPAKPEPAVCRRRGPHPQSLIRAHPSDSEDARRPPLPSTSPRLTVAHWADLWLPVGCREAGAWVPASATLSPPHPTLPLASGGGTGLRGTRVRDKADQDGHCLAARVGAGTGQKFWESRWFFFQEEPLQPKPVSPLPPGKVLCTLPGQRQVRKQVGTSQTLQPSQSGSSSRKPTS